MATTGRAARVQDCASAGRVSSWCWRCCWLSANTVVSTDTLVDGLWGDSPPSAARHTVQGYVSELRKLLGPVIEREGTGYVVRVDESSLDSFEFESLLERGRSQLADDPGAAASVLRAALQLWRGPPFTALDDTGVLLAERTRLEELQLLALEDRATADLALGRHREIAAELDALSREHPYREGLRAQHMLALYRSGRQAEALRAFQWTREVLVEELGIEPSPLLRQLEEQILVQDPALDLASEANGDSSGLERAGRQPVQGAACVHRGRCRHLLRPRRADREAVERRGGDAGLTAVVGPSGSGKSSLVQAGLIPALRRPLRRGLGDRDHASRRLPVHRTRSGAWAGRRRAAAGDEPVEPRVGRVARRLGHPPRRRVAAAAGDRSVRRAVRAGRRRAARPLSFAASSRWRPIREVAAGCW